jgi:hypothetical protein
MYHQVSGTLTYTGNKQGVFEAFCNITRSGDTRINFKKILIHGNYRAPASSGYFLTCCNTLKEIRIDCDYTGGTFGLLHTYSAGAAQLEFIEILGNATGMVIYGSVSETAIKRGGVIHLGYDGKTNLTPSNIFSSNFVSSQTLKCTSGMGPHKNMTKPSWMSILLMMHGRLRLHNWIFGTIITDNIETSNYETRNFISNAG